MKPGRELDALVAEKVMGIFLPNDPRYAGAGGTQRYVRDHDQIPCFSTSITAAWEIVGKMRRSGFQFVINDGVDSAPEKFHAAFNIGRLEVFNHARDCDTAPLAICLAALCAVGYPK